ncbi:serine protease inhibitor ecotin [Shewanella sp. 4_MG-2023]|uniref:serine protease inhibitor ecotin n=1 Tax=Shewanella sp. 4_MG-2023 TaxID=3062652 RepID=UPI0026E22CD7|nr:serine protease inhibitor ecotin [Shewanella sp. 4_MG-2023]MDO6678821.1 serine protease inhibitor ecotin [Shewanella sp. 4_MG-2023]
MKISLKNPLNKLYIASLLTLSATILVPAYATSPVPNQFSQPSMIIIHQNTDKNYQVIETAKMFPKPEADQVQHILQLSQRDDEANYKIEIQIGQNKLVDCNHHRLSGKLVEQNLSGWGYPFYSVDSITVGPSTMMMCNEPKTAKFVPMGQSLSINYDSRLPKIFYLPEDATLRYRIWQAKGDYHYSN